MKQEFVINSKKIAKIVINPSLSYFKIETKGATSREQILKNLEQYKRLKDRDAELLFQFTCSIEGEADILVEGLGIQEALISLKLGRYINEQQYMKINNFVNKNMSPSDDLSDLSRKKNILSGSIMEFDANKVPQPFEQGLPKNEKEPKQTVTIIDRGFISGVTIEMMQNQNVIPRRILTKKEILLEETGSENFLKIFKNLIENMPNEKVDLLCDEYENCKQQIEAKGFKGGKDSVNY